MHGDDTNILLVCIVVFLVMTSCSLVDWQQWFEGTYFPFFEIENTKRSHPSPPPNIYRYPVTKLHGAIKTADHEKNLFFEQNAAIYGLTHSYCLPWLFTQLVLSYQVQNIHY